MYHPAAALHQVSLRETLFHDIRGLPGALVAAREALGHEKAPSVQSDAASTTVTTSDARADDAEQMTLF
jgi:hypothetical protein